MLSNTTIGLECEENGFITNRNIEDENIINCKNDTEINEKEEQKPYFLNKTMHLIVNSNSQNNSQNNIQNNEINNCNGDCINYNDLIKKFDTGSIIIDDDTSCDTLCTQNIKNNLHNNQTDIDEEQIILYDQQLENNDYINCNNDEQLKPKLPNEYRCSNKSKEKCHKKKIVTKEINSKNKKLFIKENVQYTINTYNQNPIYNDYIQLEETNIQQLLQIIPQINTLELDVQILYLIDNITINRLLNEIEKIWNEIPKPIQKKVFGIVNNYNMIYNVYDNESLRIMNSLFKEYLVQIMRKLWNSVGFNWKNFYYQWSNHFIDIYDSWE